MYLQEEKQHRDSQEQERTQALKTLLSDIAHAAIRNDEPRLRKLLKHFGQEEQKRVSTAVEVWLRAEPLLPSGEQAAYVAVESTVGFKRWVSNYIPSFIRTCELRLGSYTSCYRPQVNLSEATLPEGGGAAPMAQSHMRPVPTPSPVRGTSHQPH